MCRAEPTKEAFYSISFVAERPTEPYLFISGGRAEPMKKAKRSVFFMAQVHHGFGEIISNGGRAEPTKKLFEIANLCGARSTLVDSSIIESGRAEI
jgi:hypothetical protein